MPLDEYAIYALGLTSLSIVNVGSDLGLTGSLNYFWRQSEQNWDAMAPKIAAVRKLRFMLLIIASTVCAVLFLKSAVAEKVTLASVLGILFLVVFTAAMQMRTVVNVQLLRLEGQQRKSYLPDIVGSAIRLLFAVGMIATSVTTAWFGLTGGLLGAAASLLMAGLIVGTKHNVPGLVSKETWREMGRYLLPVSPGVLVFMVQEPLILWMAANYGGNIVVAEVFALGRIAAIFGLFGSFIVIVVTPRLARIADERRFVRVWFAILLILIAISLIAITLTQLWPSIPLLLIGSKYTHLSSEVVISIGNASVTVLFTFVVLANRVRGWVRFDPLIAVAQSIAITLFALHWTFDDPKDVLIMSLSLASIYCFNVFIVSIVGLLKPDIVTPNWTTS